MSILRSSLAVALAIAASTLAPLPAQATAAETTLEGAIDFTGTTPGSTVTVTAFLEPSAWVATESLVLAGTTTVDYSGDAAIVPFSLDVASGVRVYIDFAGSSSLELAPDWWLGAGGVVAGAYPLVDPIPVASGAQGATSALDVGTVTAVRTGAIAVPLISQKAPSETARLNCVYRLDDTLIGCSTGALSGLYPGTYRLRSSAASLVETVHVTSGATSFVDFSDGATVSGRVIDGHGKPVAGITVSTSSSFYSGPSVITNANGKYTLTGLAPGAVRLSVFDAKAQKRQLSTGSTAAGWGSIGDEIANDPIVVRGLSTRTTTTAPAITIKRKGRVTATVGLPKGHRGVVLVTRNDRQWQKTTVSSSDTRLSFYGTSGTYRIYFIDHTGSRKYAARTVTLRAGRTVRLGRVPLTHSTVVVKGGVPGQQSGTVELRTTRGSASAAAVLASAKVTDSGMFTIRSVVPRSYYSLVRDYGHEPSDRSARVKATTNRTGVRALTASVTRATGSAMWAGRPVVGSVSVGYLANDCYEDQSVKISELGSFSYLFHASAAQAIAVSSRALFRTSRDESDCPPTTSTPYYFAFDRSTVTAAQLPSLTIIGIGGR